MIFQAFFTVCAAVGATGPEDEAIDDDPDESDPTLCGSPAPSSWTPTGSMLMTGMLSTIFSRLSASDGIPWEDTGPEIVEQKSENPGEPVVAIFGNMFCMQYFYAVNVHLHS